jgi:DNA-binding NtrC family response regulator
VEKKGHITKECKGKSVLIVDDNKLICWGLEKMLSGRGLFIKCVHSGKDAMTEVGIGLYHWVLLDIHLPDANGLDLLKDIKTLVPRTKVIVMSGNDTGSNRQKALERGALLFVPKPFTEQEIGSLVVNLFPQ